MTDLDVLISARSEVANGWCKHALEDDDGNVCMNGALNRAVTGIATVTAGDVQGAYGCLVRVIPGHSVAGWNNAPTTALEDVLAAFDRAINAEAAKVIPVTDTAHTFGVAA